MEEFTTENEQAGASVELHSSLDELSKEMALLGLQPLATADYSRPVEVCEALLNAAWCLIQRVHCDSNGSVDIFQEEREIRTREENILLETRLSQMERKLKANEVKLQQEVDVSLSLKVRNKKLNAELEKQQMQIQNLKSKLAKQEDLHKCDILKKEVENERFRCLLQSQKGISGQLSSPENEVRKALVSLSLTSDRFEDSETKSLMECAINRLMTSNQDLISENLCLRDSLQNIHSDLALLIKTANSLKIFLSEDNTAEDFEENPLPANAFRLPLSHAMEILSKFRTTQVSSLNESLTLFRSFVFQHSLNPL